MSSAGKEMNPKLGHMYRQQSEANLLRVSAMEPMAAATASSVRPRLICAATEL